VPLYPLNYEPQNAQDRDRALFWFRQQAREAQRLILLNEDPNQTCLVPGYTSVLNKLLDAYRETIYRLCEMKFNQLKEK
jgi:hypothetical protein